MHKSSYEIGASKKKLRLIAGGHYIALPMKIKKADVKAKLNADGVLEAGTLITKDGKVIRGPKETKVTLTASIVFLGATLKFMKEITKMIEFSEMRCS